MTAILLVWSVALQHLTIIEYNDVNLCRSDAIMMREYSEDKAVCVTKKWWDV